MDEGFLKDGPEKAEAVLIMAHGAGAGMDTPFMNHVACGLGKAGIGVVRFEFPYMRRRREEGTRRPPDRMPALQEAFVATIDAVRKARESTRLVVGGKSMGGRVASMVADELNADGVVCLGYPFHPAGRPESLRTAHLESLRTPTLILQGTRDALGNREEVERLALSPSIEIWWAEDGNHDLKPRKSSGRTASETLDEAVARVAAFVLVRAPGKRARS